ncbi:MAG TPA: VWA domain-containing protein [Candidatus Saccharimonadales bacterium]|nr:VWA domain-containing protein [Candidatus Saccharimonadales bacterium]
MRKQRIPGVRSLVVALAHFAFASAACAQAAAPSPQAPAIRVSVDRVDVGVIVTDAQGQFVAGLQPGDFHVFDNGTEQPVSDFAAIETPGQILLLVEAGPAVYLLESNHLLAAHVLLAGLAPDDRVAVARYNENPEGILDFTSDKGNVAGALEQLRFNSGFGALNLSSSVSKVLDWLANVKGKKTILLLSTGVDTSPLSDFQSALSRLKTSDVRILAVSLTGGLRNPQPGKKRKSALADKALLTAQQFAEADETLKQLAEATGGRAYFPNSLNDFTAVYAQIAQLVRHEYSIAFTPAMHDAKLHLIDVRVTPPATTPSAGTADGTYKVDHRAAYLAPAP